MQNGNRIVLTLGIFLSLGSFTSFGMAKPAPYPTSAPASSAAPANCDHCGNAPISVPKGTSVFPVEVAEAAFKNGTRPSIQSLAGDWILVGYVSVPGTGWSYKIDAVFSPIGFSNNDGTASNILHIEKAPTDPFASPTDETGVIKLLNLGGKDRTQGPFAISFNSASFCFSQFIYKQNDSVGAGELRKSYFGSECRELSQDPTKMICAKTFFLDPTESDVFNSQGDGLVVSYQAFSKQ